MSIHTYLRLAERVQYTLSVVAATRCHHGESVLHSLRGGGNTLSPRVGTRAAAK